jgi:hypothetical protein
MDTNNDPPYCRFVPGTTDCADGTFCANPYHGNWYSPEGKPWCTFGLGTTECINGPFCLNPNHIDHKDIWGMDYPEKDRYGRPVMPHPLTGEKRPWTRVTTIVETLEDKYNLNVRDQRLVAYGVGARDDIYDLAASADGPDDKGTLDEVVKKAKAVAFEDLKSNIGTALHGFTQKVDRGDKNVRIPKRHQKRLQQYVDATGSAGIEFIPDLIEIIVINPELEYIGTMDRGVFWRRHGLKVSTRPIAYDIKSGNLNFAMLKAAQQLAAYANATHKWNPEAKVWEPLEMNRDTGLILHLPGTEDEEPTLHQVDLIAGYELLQKSIEVREIRRSRGKGLFKPVPIGEAPSAEPAKPEPVDLLAVLIERVRGIQNAGYIHELLNRYPADWPTLKDGGLSEDQLNQIAQWCDEIERDHGIT